MNDQAPANSAPFPTAHGDELRGHAQRRLERFEVRRLDRDSAKHAAVAMTFAPNAEGEACFLLTRRSSRLKNHRGQWALPGGRMDPGEVPEQTALRELAEEVGLELGPEHVLGSLDDYATRSGYVITPIVAFCPDYRELVPNPDEVARLYRVPLADLERPDVPVLRTIPESDQPVLSMPILGHFVHAPTAAIIYQTLEVALRGNDVRVAHYEQPVFAWR